MLFSPSLETVYYGKSLFHQQNIKIVPIATGITKARESVFTNSVWGTIDSSGFAGAPAYTVGWTA